ncbi:unnamed protein product, partial [Phaeothamnion confervicola]
RLLVYPNALAYALPSTRSLRSPIRKRNCTVSAARGKENGPPKARRRCSISTLHVPSSAKLLKGANNAAMMWHLIFARCFGLKRCKDVDRGFQGYAFGLQLSMPFRALQRDTGEESGTFQSRSSFAARFARSVAVYIRKICGCFHCR